MAHTNRLLDRRWQHDRSGFTLIELLVVIAIIALLISLLLPALKDARLLSRQIKESSQMRQVATAWNFYTHDYKEGIIPSYISATDTPTSGYSPYSVYDHTRLELRFWVAKRWVWWLMPYLNYDLQIFYDDVYLNEILARPSDPTGTSGYQLAYTNNTRFGYNSLWVAGDNIYQSGINLSFRDGNGNARAGAWRTARVPHKANQINRPDRLMLFGTTRGVDWNTGVTGWRERGGGDRVVPGYFRMYPPFYVNGSASSTTLSRVTWWTANRFEDWKESDPLKHHGNIDSRHFGKPIIGFVDTHVETDLGLRLTVTGKNLWLMSYWANEGTDNPNWIPPLIR